MKTYNFAVFIDGFPYKSYVTFTGAKMFVKKLSAKDKARATIQRIGGNSKK